jgi:galactokinase
MQESHASLRDDYEVSCNELDVMANLANNFPGCFGARMTGGGFGGCTINLVRVEQVEEFAIHMREGYQGATGIAPEIYSCAAAEGASEIS